MIVQSSSLPRTPCTAPPRNMSPPASTCTHRHARYRIGPTRTSSVACFGACMSAASVSSTYTLAASLIVNLGEQSVHIEPRRRIITHMAWLVARGTCIILSDKRRVPSCVGAILFTSECTASQRRHQLGRRRVHLPQTRTRGTCQCRCQLLLGLLQQRWRRCRCRSRVVAALQERRQHYSAVTAS